jgi:hypothetical protein
VEFRFELGPRSLEVTVSLPAQSVQLAEDAAEELRGRLTEGLARTVTLAIGPRREPLDLYA